MITFSNVFVPAMGGGCAILLILLGIRIIEAAFFLMGYKIGQERNKPRGIDPVLLKQGVTEIVNDIINKKEPPINPA